ncbi:hypothetical protein [Halorubellus sp. PRR65]|uniref:hypothetical protein n=1 Tax=Halorubellus sp. PRR65 TaxID=3098148 RepID=UPI002B261E4F|nr:hypothetical protein [Halorubellus sp. PRR65]
MPSRRTALRRVGVATAVGLAGCSVLDRGVDGYVQLKSIFGTPVDGEDRGNEHVLRVQLASSPGSEPPDLRQHDDRWTDRFDDPRRPVVSDDLHADLEREYDDLHYLVGVCSPAWADDDERIGCYNVRTTRENFNAVQVHQRVRASSDGTSLTIHSTDGQWAFDSDEDAT